jgi:putative transposase
MPRANRYILPDCVYHLTHRCHNGAFLLRFARDRTAYRARLRESVRECRISLLAYCITSNHTHLLATASSPGGISRFMQKLEGDFAQYYNRRKARSGAFWGDRFHSTLVESGEHLRNCLAYIDLNMVRAGVVVHPREWPWCGYHELVGQRRRYRMLDVERLLWELGRPDLRTFRAAHESSLAESIRLDRLHREAMWTESIAVGSRSFVSRVAQQTKNRSRLYEGCTTEGTWFLRDSEAAYGVATPKADRGASGARSRCLGGVGLVLPAAQPLS